MDFLAKPATQLDWVIIGHGSNVHFIVDLGKILAIFDDIPVLNAESTELRVHVSFAKLTEKKYGCQKKCVQCFRN